MWSHEMNCPRAMRYQVEWKCSRIMKERGPLGLEGALSHSGGALSNRMTHRHIGHSCRCTVMACRVVGVGGLSPEPRVH